MDENSARDLLKLPSQGSITRAQVRKAFFKVSKENHPDKIRDLPDDEKERREELFKQQTEAKDFLDGKYNLQLGGGTRKKRLRKYKKTKRNKKIKTKVKKYKNTNSEKQKRDNIYEEN